MTIWCSFSEVLVALLRDGRMNTYAERLEQCPGQPGEVASRMPCLPSSHLASVSHELSSQRPTMPVPRPCSADNCYKTSNVRPHNMLSGRILQGPGVVEATFIERCAVRCSVVLGTGGATSRTVTHTTSYGTSGTQQALVGILPHKTEPQMCSTRHHMRWTCPIKLNALTPLPVSKTFFPTEFCAVASNCMQAPAGGMGGSGPSQMQHR